MLPDTYYGSLVLPVSAAKNIQTSLGETYQQFCSRHAKVLDKLLSTSDPGANVRYRLHRLLVIQDSVIPPASFDPGWVKNGFTDCDGLYRLDNNYQPIRQDVTFWDDITKTDFGVIHEQFHTTLHLSDQYALDYNEEPHNHHVTSNLPLGWQLYNGLTRNDYAYDILTGLPPISGRKQDWKVGPYTALLLNRRNRNHINHDFAYLFRTEFIGFPAVWPETITLLPKTITHQELSVVRAECFRTKSGNDGYHKLLPADPQPIRTNQGKPEFSPNVLFSSNEGVIKTTEGTVLFLFTDSQGLQHFRWMDVRDFSIPALSTKANRKHVELSFNCLPVSSQHTPDPTSF